MWQIKWPAPPAATSLPKLISAHKGQPGCIAPIIGPRTLAHLEDALASSTQHWTRLDHPLVAQDFGDAPQSYASLSLANVRQDFGTLRAIRDCAVSCAQPPERSAGL
jgi:hypothetical protein